MNRTSIFFVAILLGFCPLCWGWVDGSTGESPAIAAAEPLQESAPKPSSERLKQDFQSWELLYVKDTPVGARRFRSEFERAKDEEIRMEMESLVRISVGGEVRIQKVLVKSIGPVGGMRSFTARLDNGSDRLEADGRVAGQMLNITVTRNGKVENKSLKWDSSYGGPFAIEQWFLRNAPKKEDHPKIKFLDPIGMEIVETEFRFNGRIKTPLLSGESVELLEIDTLTKFGEKGIRNTYWVDSTGRQKKSYLSLFDLRSFECSESEAKAIQALAELDATPIGTVALNKGISDRESVESIQYRIQMEGEDPYGLVSARTNQAIQRGVTNVITLTVFRTQSKKVLPRGVERESIPGKSYLAATKEMDSNDEAIVQLANKFIAEAPAGQPVIQTLLKGVHQSVSKKELTKQFRTASEVARLMEGDCSEHAFLLVALLRSQKVPARLAFGIVALPESKTPAMGFHVWTEAWMTDRWVPLDPTTGEAPAAPDHIKFFESSIEDGNSAMAMLRVLKGMEKMTIEVLQ